MGRPRKRGSPRSVARRPVGQNKSGPLLLVSDRFGRWCRKRELTHSDRRGEGPGECDNGGPRAGLGRGPRPRGGLRRRRPGRRTQRRTPMGRESTGASAITAARGPASTRGQLGSLLRTAKDQPVISSLLSVEESTELSTRSIRTAKDQPVISDSEQNRYRKRRQFPQAKGRNLGVGACGRGSSGQSQHRRRPGPGGSTRVKLPITGE